MSPYRIALALCSLLVWGAWSHAQTIRTVSTQGPGPGPWATPYSTIESALAVSIDGDEVWVAAGTYTSPVNGYVLPSGVRLRGGFAGTELTPQARNPDFLAHPTALAGNSRTILFSSSASSGTLVERFTLRGGLSSSSDNNGGAIRLSSFSGTIHDCVFTQNTTRTFNASHAESPGGNGGAIWMSSSTARIVNCTFSDNQCSAGSTGGCNVGHAPGPQSGGSGGAFFFVGSSPTFLGCTFSNNQAGAGSMGLECTASQSGGGNGGMGGGIAGENSSPRLEDCVFTNNRAGAGGQGRSFGPPGSAGGMGGSGGAMSLTGAGVVTLTHCSFTGNAAGASGANATGSVSASPAGGEGGAIRLSSLTEASISRCFFDSNTAGRGGDGPPPLFPPVSGNGGAGGNGGAVMVALTPTTIANSVFTRNRPGDGGTAQVSPPGTGGAAGSGAIAARGATASFHLINCTLAFNRSAGGGSGAMAGAATVATELVLADSIAAEVRNSIVWNGFPSDYPPYAGDVSISYSDVSGGATGPGNIPGNPLFTNAALNDFRPARHSPCVDAGNNAVAPTMPDQSGFPRFVDDPGTIDTGVPGGAGGAAIVDMGAYEFQPEAPPCPGDFNRSGGDEVQDIFDFLGAWFAGAPAADFNGVDGLTVQDIFDFLAAWFAGC